MKTGLQAEEHFSNKGKNLYAGECLSFMGREPIKSQAKFLRNRKVISGNQGLLKNMEEFRLFMKSTKCLRNENSSLIFHLVQTEHSDIKVD